MEKIDLKEKLICDKRKLLEMQVDLNESGNESKKMKLNEMLFDL